MLILGYMLLGDLREEGSGDEGNTITRLLAVVVVLLPGKNKL